ncbi:MAG TPA: hypothetical protein VN777_07160 [Terriglobales bacterium]|nr:hypothetical protein [Terriglobales bacterium]HZW96186.1 hypothetical protein [Candidatus Eremiobacteraceae bacterium]
MAGELAKNEEGILPVVVKMDDWWRELRSLSPLDALCTLAVREVPVADRSLFELELRSRAESGDLALLLDGLDETRERRFAATAKVDELLAAVHPGVDIIITTRDSAYSAGKTLQFREVTLTPARNIEYTIRRIIATAAAHNSTELVDAKAWEDRRAAWVIDAIERDDRLKETPLVPVLLAVLAGEPSRDSLPGNRAEVLTAVIDSILDRWEISQRRHGEIQLGALQSTAAVSALRGSFSQLGFLLLRTGGAVQQVLITALSGWLADTWGLAPGFADSTAQDVLHFWDESGAFVSSGPEPVVRPRISLLSETGAARYIIELDPNRQYKLLSELALEATVSEAVTLAALLSPAVCEIVVRSAVSSGSLERQGLASQCLLDGASVSAEAAESLAVALTEQSVGRDRAWSVANSVARLPVSFQTKMHCLEALAATLGEQRYRLVCAGAALHSNEPIPEPAQVLADACSEMRAGRRGAGGLGWRSTREVQELVSRMATSMLPARPDLAPAFAEAGKQGNLHLHQTVSSALGRIKRFDLIREPLPYLMYDWTARDEEHRKAWREFLRIFIGLAEKRSLNGVEARRLDNIADLIATLGYSETTVGELELALRTAGEDLRALVHMCATLAGFEGPAVAAEAEVALAMEAESHDSESLLFCGAKKRRLQGWERFVDRESSLDIAVRLLGSTRWIAQVAAEALSSCPLVQFVVRGVDERIRTWEAFNRLVAGELVMKLDTGWRERASLWKALDDPIVRRVAAEALAKDSGMPVEDLLDWFLNDGDAWVRTAVIEALPISRSLNALALVRIRELLAKTPPSWLCIWCNKISPAGTTSCAHCQITGPDFLSSASKLLGRHTLGA